jgi:hypothetical protein
MTGGLCLSLDESGGSGHRAFDPECALQLDLKEARAATVWIDKSAHPTLAG